MVNDEQLEENIKAALCDVMDWDELADRVLELEAERDALKERLAEQIEDNGRINDEKMKWWHEVEKLRTENDKFKNEMMELMVKDIKEECGRMKETKLRENVDRLVEAAKKVVRIIDHDAHVKAVFELEAALAQFLEAD